MIQSEILSVTQLTSAIKQKLESSFSSLSVKGEVSNLRHTASGHIYFTLKDEGSQISAVLFRGNAMQLSQPLKEGDQIIVSGEISLYVPRGNYQILVRAVEFSGVGELLKKLHALKLQLQQRGWFNKELKKPLPKLPKRIGVVTSPTGSVIQDIINVLSRRFSGFHLILNPVRVQGTEAASEIAKAIHDFNRYELADVLIVGRGGGSIEDLWPFNEEIVAAAIHQSKIPIISAVGHETDFTIADFVADLRAPTPSAAAEIVIEEKEQLLAQLKKGQLRMLQALQAHVRQGRRMLEGIKRDSLFKNPYTLLSPFLQKIDESQEELKSMMMTTLKNHQIRLQGLQKQKEALNPRQQLLNQKRAFAQKSLTIHWAMKALLEKKKERLSRLVQHLHSLNPKNLLKMGYSIVFCEKTGSVILSTKAIQKEEGVRIRLSDGELLAHIKGKKDD